MRTLIISLLFLPTLVFADQESKIFKYECEHVNQATTNFTCQLNEGMKLHMLKPDGELTKEQKERADYEFNKITLRYLELGGREFDVTAAWWPENAKRQCYAFHNSTKYRCTDCLIQKDGSCKAVNK